MVLPEDGLLLRVFIGESDKHDGIPLYEWIVRKAREHGLAGATVLRGIMGYGGHSRIHSAKILRLSEDLPVIVEIVDVRERLEAFLSVIDGAIPEGLATTGSVRVRFYRGGTGRGTTQGTGRGVG
ncbi:MAG TPA: DUF190 domain-containing protein [Firmicutes bacterium]|nr:DUF190 domain-containing protein [Bacillota bacterium]